MKYKIAYIFIFAAIIGLVSCTPKSTQSNLNLDNYIKDSVSVQDFATWGFCGMGKAFDAGGNQYCISENDSTVGVVLISPKAYKGDVIIRYKTMALTTSTVLVFMHSVTDAGLAETLTIPDNYNGNMGLWMNEKQSYFYAFKNASHNFTPFIRKYPVPGNNALVLAADNFMIPGKYYAIEIARVGNKLWLSVDGQKILETVDNEMYLGGHLVFRIRGTAGLKAVCLIKDLEIYSEKN